MSKPDTQAIALQLESSNSKDRLLALASLREVTPEEAVPLIKKVLYDDVGYFLEDKEAVAAVFAKSMTENKVRECLAFRSKKTIRINRFKNGNY